MTYIYVCKS